MIWMFAGCTPSPSPDPLPEAMHLDEVHNARIDVDLALTAVQVQPRVEICVDVTGLTVDLMDRPLEWVDGVALLQLDLDVDDLDALIVGGLTPDDFDIVSLAEFTQPDLCLPPLSESPDLQLLTLTTPAGLGPMLLLEPSAGSDRTTVAWTDAHSELAVFIDPVGEGLIPGPDWIDWSAIHTDGHGPALRPPAPSLSCSSRRWPPTICSTPPRAPPCSARGSSARRGLASGTPSTPGVTRSRASTAESGS